MQHPSILLIHGLSEKYVMDLWRKDTLLVRRLSAMGESTVWVRLRGRLGQQSPCWCYASVGRVATAVLITIGLAVLLGGLPVGCTGKMGPAYQGTPLLPVPDLSHVGHPRLWLRQDMLDSLRARASAANPLYAVLSELGTSAKAAMDSGRLADLDDGGATYTELRTEEHALLFAFLSLVDPSSDARRDFAARAKKLIMAALRQAKKGVADAPFRAEEFPTSDRSRWWGEAWALTVDWIYPVLTDSDKHTIRAVFLKWSAALSEATTTTNNHPEPHGVVNNEELVRDRNRVRWAGNNYYTAHLRNLGLMSLALDAADDPDGQLRARFREASGAWLYVVDNLLRTDARGGLGAEGLEYTPQTLAYVAHLLLAIHSAGLTAADWGPQVEFAGNPFWDDLVAVVPHQLSPGKVAHPWGGSMHQAAWYGDGQKYDELPDPIALLGALGWYDAMAAHQVRLAAIRWLQLYLPTGGREALLERMRHSSFTGAILYFLLFDSDHDEATDPRANSPVLFYAPGIGHLYARTGWDEQASWFHYNLGWIAVDHQHGDGNQFGFYRGGEWLTKEYVGYDFRTFGKSEFHNTLAVKNIEPAHADDYRGELWQAGSQWMYSVSGDPQLVAHSLSKNFVYALGDATPLYNAASEGATAVSHVSRAILWLKPDHIVIYDRAMTDREGLFKRFWLQIPAAPVVTGNRAVVTTSKGQQLVVTTLLPPSATPEAVSGPDTVTSGEAMKSRLLVEAPGDPPEAYFLHVLQGCNAGTSADAVALVRTAAGDFEGAVFGATAVLFPKRITTHPNALAETSYDVSAQVSTHIITGLAPGTGYALREVPNSTPDTVRVTLSPAADGTTADSGGVWVWHR